jgi:hypothetical protein
MPNFPFDHSLQSPELFLVPARSQITLYDISTFRSAAGQALLTQPALYSPTFEPSHSKLEQAGVSVAIGPLLPLRFARPPLFFLPFFLPSPPSLCAKADYVLMQATARAARYFLLSSLIAHDARLTSLTALDLLLHGPFHPSVPSHHSLAQARRDGLPDD